MGTSPFSEAKVSIVCVLLYLRDGEFSFGIHVENLNWSNVKVACRLGEILTKCYHLGKKNRDGCTQVQGQVAFFFSILWSEDMNQSKTISGWASALSVGIDMQQLPFCQPAGRPAPPCAQDQVHAINLCYYGPRHEETQCWMWLYKSQSAIAAPWPL